VGTEKKRSTKPRTASKKAVKLNAADELAALRLENKKLRATLSDTWEVLNAVDAESSGAEMFAAIDTACRLAVKNHPREFQYEESVQGEPGAIGSLVKAASGRIRRSIAKDLKVSQDGISKVDFNQFLPAWRRAMLPEMGVDPDKLEKVTPDQYVAQVYNDIVLSILFSAEPPTTPRNEIEKYLGAVLKIKAAMPQRRRKAAEEVERALEMLKAGKSWGAIYLKLKPDLYDTSKTSKADRVTWKRSLQNRVLALKVTRQKRASGKANRARKKV
jgi:hypothetical protein